MSNASLNVPKYIRTITFIAAVAAAAAAAAVERAGPNTARKAHEAPNYVTTKLFPSPPFYVHALPPLLPSVAAAAAARLNIPHLNVSKIDKSIERAVKWSNARACVRVICNEFRFSDWLKFQTFYLSTFLNCALAHAKC